MKSGKLVSLYAGAIVAATLGLSGTAFADPPQGEKGAAEAKKPHPEKPSVTKPDSAQVGASKADTKSTHTTAPNAMDARVKREKPGAASADESSDEKAQRSEHKASAKPFRKMGKAERKAFQIRLKELNAERKASRKERSEKEREELKTQFRSEEPSAPVQAELKVHAWRMARLSRLLELAQARELEEAIARIQELQKKEEERHAKKLIEVKAQGASAAKPSATTPSATTPSAPKAVETAAPQKKESL